MKTLLKKEPVQLALACVAMFSFTIIACLVGIPG